MRKGTLFFLFAQDKRYYALLMQQPKVKPGSIKFKLEV